LADSIDDRVAAAATAATAASTGAGPTPDETGTGPNAADVFAAATAAAGVARVTDGKVMEVGANPIQPAKSDPNDQSAAIGKAIWVLLPPIAMKQYRIWQRAGVPVAYACWAHLSDETEAALKAGVCRVAPEAWASGPNFWPIEAVVPFGGREEVLATLKREVFGERTVKSLQPAPGGGLGVVEW
jgi:hemolysin-activating ACP:hemolysin acyltransferase